MPFPTPSHTCYQYQLVFWIRSNFDSNSSVNELKNNEITDSSSTKYRFRRYPAKNFVISWWWFLTRSQCVTCQSRKCAHQISHLQASNEDVLKSSLCQLCKIYVISASKPFQFAGISSSNVSWVLSYIHLDIQAVFCRCYVGLLFIASRGNVWGWSWWIETLRFPERKRKRKREFYWKSANHYQLEQYSTPWIAEFHVHFYVDTNHLIDINYCFK